MVNKKRRHLFGQACASLLLSSLTGGGKLKIEMEERGADKAMRADLVLKRPSTG